MHGKNDGDPNLVPLLDLVLQLIMFFMITVNFVRVEQFNDEVKLPVVQNAVVMDKTADRYVFLSMNKDGKLVGSAAGRDTFSKLKAFLQEEKARIERVAREEGYSGPVKIVVVLRAHKDARYRDVWTTLKSCTEAGFRHWQMRVMTAQKKAA